MSFGPIPLFRICKNCNYHFVEDGGTLRMNRESFLKCPKCGSDSIEDKIKQKEYDEDLKKRIKEFFNHCEDIVASSKQV